jgi:nucleoside-diphosphate-sugar epimerase
MTDRLTAVVTGAGGFIGGYLVKRLLSSGYEVRAVDIKPFNEWWQRSPDAEEWECLDVSTDYGARVACYNVNEVYNLACRIGGMGFISTQKLTCMLNVRVSAEMLPTALREGVSRFFHSSSACIYPVYLQNTDTTPFLKESDAYLADPEDGYGWEKLFTERLCRHFTEETSLDTRVARYHNIYGPHGTWRGGLEKAPAAMCRKVALAKIFDRKELEIWDGGTATRTFTYIDDCIEGTMRVMHGPYADPVNIGSDEVVTIDELARTVEQVAGIELQHVYVPGPRGVQGRSSDNTLIRERYDWEPSVKLLHGIENTYAWVHDQLKRSI